MTSIFSDDELADFLTLKGGTLLDLIWKITKRPSVDIDFSVDTLKSNLEDVSVFKSKLKSALEEGFKKGINGEPYTLLDFKLEPRPEQISEDLKSFWGGYLASFSIVKTKEFTSSKNDKNKALLIGVFGKKKDEDVFLSPIFTIDISLHEICTEYRKEEKIDGCFIEIYTPLMVVYEKLRAICQTDDRYKDVIKRTRDAPPRTKYFYDIYMIVNALEIDVLENIALLKSIFGVKRVPI